jgi:hypothetical protein
MARQRENKILKRRLTNLEMLVSYLRNSPESIANNALQTLRNCSSINSALRIPDPTLQSTFLSEQKTALAYLPAVHSHQELELMAQHPKAYPTLDPMCDQSLFRDLAINTPHTISHIGPQLPKGYFHTQLCNVNIAFWTSIPVSDQFAAESISLFLATDYPFNGFFNSELFIKSLMQGTSDFCSPFLVSSLLAFACVSLKNPIL